MKSEATTEATTEATISGSGCGAQHGQPSAGEREPDGPGELMVSLRAEVPEALLVSMRLFIDQHPNWDQYRLFQAAVAGFLVQNGVQSRDVTRCYLANLFPSQERFRCG
ncbi:MAG: DUF2811 domain-containing protein [Prochlorococcaceae cyanobacterium]